MNVNILKTLGVFLISLLVLSACRNEDNKIEPTCFDEVQNQGELRVDCGGPNCLECPPSCDDNIANQDEISSETVNNPNIIGIDCGGETCGLPCATCEDGVQNAHWVINLNLTIEDLQYDTVGQDLAGNLYSLIMENGIDCGFPCQSYCGPDVYCFDGIQNGDEEGIDCGGSCGNPCPLPTCNDGIQNGTETGVDCGDAIEPSVCGPCPDPTCTDGIQNIHIEVSEDFVDGYIVVVETGIDCDANPFTACPDCPIASCFNGVFDYNEEGIDCGGVCITLCDPNPTCNNGIMDGDETGVDCGGTSCPPCATCGDMIKNGPEFDVDCVDYEIPEYPCPVCPSCHDEIRNSIYDVDDITGMLELDVDCGTPECGPCQIELVVAAIGADGGAAPFRDQYSYNRIQAEFGQDTLELNHNQFPGLSVEKVVGGFGGPAHLIVTANQGVMTADNGIYMRTVIMYIPWPENVVTAPIPYEGAPAMNVDMVDSSPLTPGSCTPPITGQDRPYIIYQEQLVDNPSLLNRCFFSYVDDGQSSVFSIDYLNGYIQSEYYVKGSINEGSLLYEPIPLPGVLDIEGSFTGLEFKLQYPYIL